MGRYEFNPQRLLNFFFMLNSNEHDFILLINIKISKGKGNGQILYSIIWPRGYKYILKATTMKNIRVLRLAQFQGK